MPYFTSQNIGNAVQTIKYVELSRFQLILKLYVTFVDSLFTLKPFKRFLLAIFTNSDLCQNEGAIHNLKLLIMLEYWLCCLICAESDK